MLPSPLTTSPSPAPLRPAVSADTFAIPDRLSSRQHDDHRHHHHQQQQQQQHFTPHHRHQPQLPQTPVRSLRKLKSAYALSSVSSLQQHPFPASNATHLLQSPLLPRQHQQHLHRQPTQQLQQAQQSQQQYPHIQHPAILSSRNDAPPVSNIASHARTRSNSDAVLLGFSSLGVDGEDDGSATITPRRHAAAAKRLLRAALTNGSKYSKDRTLDNLMREGPRDGELHEALDCMRYQVLSNGIGSDTDGMSSLRIYVWLILLCAPPIDTDEYLALVHRGPSPAYAKIRNDTFRTLATDPLFRRRVSEASLIRLLNAVAWTLHDRRQHVCSPQPSPSANATSHTAATLPSTTTNSARHSSANECIDGNDDGRADFANSESDPATTPSNAEKLRMFRDEEDDESWDMQENTPEAPAVSSTSFSSPAVGGSVNDDKGGGTELSGIYVQGMNVIAAPFLYAARSEAEAFVAFERFMLLECPGYVRGAMDGVHRGVALVDKVLATVDPKLAAYLLSKGMHAELYAFPSVLTFCACTPPLPEVLRLWDFFFAFGAHLNIVCIVAQLVLMRDTILANPSPVKILRSFPPLDAARIKALTVSLVSKIPDSLYDEMVRHAK